MSNLKKLNNDAPYIEYDHYPSYKLKGITDILKHDSFKKATQKNECPHVESAIIVAADSDTKLGNTTLICRNKECKTHFSHKKPASDKSPTEKAQLKKRNEYNKRRKQEMAAMNVYRRQLIKEVVRNLPKDDLEFFKTLALRRHHVHKKCKSFIMNIAAADELKIKHNKKDDFGDTTHVNISVINDCKDRLFLQKLIFASVIDSFVNIDNWQTYERLKSENKEHGDYLLEAADLILGKAKVSGIIKEAKAKYIKPEKKSKPKSNKKTKSKK